MNPKPRILVIVGPTASGKTSLSIRLAQKFNGEIISADSRQVYRGLDLGTGKVTLEEMAGVPHHLLDVADPTHTYTVADFVQDGRAAIADIIARGKLPIVVGGTFFYIDALLGTAGTPDVPPNPALREELDSLTAEELLERLKARDPKRAHAIDAQNKRRLIRALEITEVLGQVPEVILKEPYHALTLGISLPKETLHARIHERLLVRLDTGMLEEAVQLHESGLSYDRMRELGIEYLCMAEYLEQRTDYGTMAHDIEVKTHQYAKRQMTWLKRNKNILWIDPADTVSIEKTVSEFLQ